MSAWDIYLRKVTASGATKRESSLRKEQYMLEKRLPDNLSYKPLTIDGVSQSVAVINTDNLNEKYLLSLPGDDITHGGLVSWEDNYWLVTELDADKTVYTRAKMVQCNYLLKWISEDNVIHEQWCIIEDGTKYLTGEYEDRNFVVTRGDSRIAMIIARNEFTVKFQRENRFLIDDPESDHMLAYLLTKPFKLGGTYNGKGVFKFVLQEVTSTDDDNHELHIADYYKHFPRNNQEEPPVIQREGWL